MDQVALAHKEPLKGICELPRTLLHEGRGGMWGDPGNLDPARCQFHYNEDVVRHQTMPRRDLHGEEVGGSEDLPVQLEELRPAHAGLPSLRSGLHVVTPYDVTHRNLVNVMAHVRQGALDTPIAPSRILFSHLDYKPLDLLGHRWPTTLGAAHASVKLLRDQSFVPAPEGLGGGKRDDLFETLTAEGIDLLYVST
jgi:hypothetical protein